MQTSTVDFLKDLYLNRGLQLCPESDGTQLQHALATYQNARFDEADLEERVAAFLHDIGHLLNGRNEEADLTDHDFIGGEWLHSVGFPGKVVALVTHHENAKRYDLYKNGTDIRKLGKGQMEGGAMIESQARAFEMIPYFHEVMSLREWDATPLEIEPTRSNMHLVFKEIEELLNLEYA
ncbi:HDIG domain-containing metalloprotein [Jiulongibacter sp. NS-SX5]|uniref:HDIG domain-containing metalloprotein n=1 Tax=Jiulongibacter sp. NS-SX5 TaxID=3463854 RepID=UPI00405A1A6E